MYAFAITVAATVVSIDHRRSFQIPNMPVSFRNSQSSQPIEPTIQILVYSLNPTKTHMTAEETARAVITSGPHDSGFTKFGTTPGGGGAAGIVASCAVETDSRLMVMGIGGIKNDRRGDGFEGG